MKYLKKELPDCHGVINTIFGGMVESVWVIDPYIEITDDITNEQLTSYINEFEERIDNFTKFHMNYENEISVPDDIDLIIKLTNGTEISFENNGKFIICNIDDNEEYILL